MAINHLLGAYLVKKEGFGNEPDYNYEKDENLFGFDEFRIKSAKKAANDLIASHCASNWEELYTSRKFFKEYESKDPANDAAVDLIDNGVNFESICNIISIKLCKRTRTNRAINNIYDQEK